MSPLSKFLINDLQLQPEIMIILIGLPVIATIIGIARYYIGIKTFSLYAPILLSIAFYLLYFGYDGSERQKIAAGGVLGVVFTTIVLVTTVFSHRILKKVRLHFFPKLSIGFSLVAIFITASLVFIEKTNIIDPKDINFVSLILITLVSEPFLNTHMKKKWKVSMKLSFETLILSLICYLILVVDPIKTILLNNPELVLLTLPINFVVGQFTGLRITEYLRFRDILENDDK